MTTTFLSLQDRGAGQLAAGIGPADTSLTVGAGQGALFPSSNFIVTIDNEHLLCTSRLGDVLTVTRAQDGTAAAAHSIGSAVELRTISKLFRDVYAAVNNLESGTFDVTAYFKLAGRAGGQTAYGGTAAGDNLVLGSTANVSKGVIQLQDPVQAGGYLNVGSLTVPVNVTAGDLTATRLSVGNTAFLAWPPNNIACISGGYLLLDTPSSGLNMRLRSADSRYRSDFAMNPGNLNINAYDDTGGVYLPLSIQVTQLNLTGNSLLTGYLNVGSLTAPANTTPGDLTALRLAVGNVALTAGYAANINGNLNVGNNALGGTVTDSSPFTIKTAADVQNTAVSALYIGPTTSDSHRLFIGLDATHRFYSVDFRYVASALTSVPAVNIDPAQTGNGPIAGTIFNVGGNSLLSGYLNVAGRLVLSGVSSPSAAYTVAATDVTILGTSGAGGITVTLPDATASAGRMIWIKKVDAGAGALTIATSPNTQTIDGAVTLAMATQYEAVLLTSDGSNWYVISQVATTIL